MSQLNARSRGLLALLRAALIVAAIALVIGMVSAAASAQRASDSQSNSQRPRTSSRTKPPSPGATASRLTISELAGQRIIYAYSGRNPPQSLLAMIRSGGAAGIVFFSDNISSTGQLRAVIGRLQQASLASPVHAPLLMLTDQEGGLVRRLPGAPVLSEKAIGASSRAKVLAARAGSATATNLSSSGITVDLAPVLDVYRRPGDFIDRYQRSYSTNPATVARLGHTFVGALQGRGVAATAKHFPGLGAATNDQNTDAGPVLLRLPLSTLRGVDEAPYRAAISAGVKLIMLSWATYPALDSRLPAGLSQRVVGDELRSRLGFRGVTITDSLGAGALQPFGSYAQRGVLAARAGEDLVVCAATDPTRDSPNEGIEVLDGIERALATHELSRALARQAAARVIALRRDP